MMRDMYDFHDPKMSLNKHCLQANKGKEFKCLMAQNNIHFIRTPLYIMNSLVDSWQVNNLMNITCDLSQKNKCSKSEVSYLNNYRETMIAALNPFIEDKENAGGCYLVECYAHSIANDDRYWLHTYVEEKTNQDVMLSWMQGYENDEDHRYIDGKFESNTCAGSVAEHESHVAFM